MFRESRAASATASKFGGPTPNANFYVTSYASTPSVDVNSWRFSIKGMVENPIQFSYADIRKLPKIDEMLTLECISNPPDGTAIGNAKWTGVQLRPLLERARVKRGARFVAMRGADGYHTVLPVDEVMREENFLPYLMNGAPLPPEHGYPLRIFIPGKYGMKQPKWITELEFADHEIPGYWEVRGWSDTCWRKVNSGFFSPRVEGGLMSIFDQQSQGDCAVGHLRLGAGGTVGNQAGRSVGGRRRHVAYRAIGREQFAVCVDGVEVSFRAAGCGRFHAARARD